ncbi:hypothetical protein, partial [Streptomyces sp. NPDC008125]|uniref:hypothetical protein n=1 Tax=Streptomyces sp. NPDC008125 TaxID=3364811 RepID=UPI0036E2FC38
MSIRAFGVHSWRARKTVRRTVTAATVVLALGGAALPALADEQPAPVSVWGNKEQKLEKPEVQV